jgi:hypothetical protein
MTEFYCLVRHTPFWAIPVLILSIEFGYIFWLKKKGAKVRMCVGLGLLSMTALVWYYTAGGPEKAVRKLMVLLRDMEI